MPDTSAAVVTCEGLGKSFGGARVVDGVDLQFAAGAITALIGPNGAGKTTVFHLIAGAIRPDAGRVLLGGRRIDGLPAWRVARLGVTRLFQDVRVFPQMTVLDNVRAAIPGQAGEDLRSLLFDWRRVVGQRGSVTQTALDALARVGLGAAPEKRACELSYGQQKLLALARVIASERPVLLLDEPTAGISPQVRQALMPVLRSLANEGRTVALIEHDLAAVRELSDAVLFMDEGRILASGPAKTVLANPVLRATYLGLE